MRLGRTAIVLIAGLSVTGQIIPTSLAAQGTVTSDSTALVQMVGSYVDATRHRELSMELFSDDATFISSTGNYFAGKQSLTGFYSGLIQSTDSIRYVAGTPVVRLLDSSNALIYYTWKVDWYRSHGPRSTRLNDIGMMSITAQKRDNRWLWVAITSQGMPVFFDKITDRR